MTSSRATGEPAKGGEEVDAFSPRARKLLCSFGRPGVAKAAKRSFNKRVRKTGKAILPPTADAGPEGDVTATGVSDEGPGIISTNQVKR